MAVRNQDDGFHEIQLNGKQLVFLFMAATVVSVVIFLCGVLVGRGVRLQRGTVALAAAMNETPTPDVVRPVSTPATPVAPVGGDPTAAAPPTPVDDLSYHDRLEKPDADADAEEFKPAAVRPAVVTPPKPAPAKPAAARPAPARPAAAPQTVATTAPVLAASAPPAPAAPTPGDGYAVQVAAVNVRGDADAIVKRLASKGYGAYVQVPPGGSGSVFRVRVGTFKTRREAETVAARLQKEEQFTPWVTR